MHVSGITLIRNAQSQTIGKPNDKTVSVSKIRKPLFRIAEIVQCHICLMEGNIIVHGPVEASIILTALNLEGHVVLSTDNVMSLCFDITDHSVRNRSVCSIYAVKISSFPHFTEFANKSNTTGSTSGAGDAYLSRAYQLTSDCIVLLNL